MTHRDVMVAALVDESNAILGAVLGAPALPVETCPGWSLQDLLGHVSSAHRWASHVLEHGAERQKRILDDPPTEFGALVAWYKAGLEELVDRFDSCEPDDLVWTPTSGVTGNHWWRRKIAVETAIHRWDAEVASKKPGGPAPLPPGVAVAAIDEFVDDFLAGLLAVYADAAPRGPVRVEADDTDDRWLLALDHLRTGTLPPAELEYPTVVSGTASDLALWVWNRLADPLDRLRVDGDAAPVLGWAALRI